MRSAQKLIFLVALCLPIATTFNVAWSQQDVNQLLRTPPGTRGQPSVDLGSQGGSGPAVTDVTPLEQPQLPTANDAADAANIALHSLLPPRRPNAFVHRIASTGLLLEVVTTFASYKVTVERQLRVSEVLGPDVMLVDLPKAVLARDPLFGEFSVVVGIDSIAVVERASRIVVVVIDKRTLVAVTDDADFSLYLDVKTKQVIVVSLIASLSKEVYFDFNKSSLTALARQQLEDWGVALRDERFRGARFWITGHTDRVGSDSYNLRLSRKRAHAVADYLETFGLPGVVFYERGRGWRDLKFPDDPTDSGNRRVEITWVEVY